MYVGPNWYEGKVPLRNIVISDDRVEDTGWDGIQLKSAISGTNVISGNTLRRVGVRSDSSSKGQLFGIAMLDGNGDIEGLDAQDAFLVHNPRSNMNNHVGYNGKLAAYRNLAQFKNNSRFQVIVSGSRAKTILAMNNAKTDGFIYSAVKN